MLTYSTFQGITAPAMKCAVLATAIHCACGFAQTTTAPSDNSTDTQGEMTVISPRVPLQAGSKTSVTVEQMQRNGTTDFGSVMRYQPLISATGVSGGSSAGKSGFDRSGYTGFNIRGLESNRVGLDVDGSPLPDATGRSYVSRAGLNTFGIGRDYIDPYMYGRVDIQAGASAVEQSNTSIGGTVSFRNKSADDYLRPDKESYFGYQSDYDSSNRGWHNGITAAAGDSTLRGVVVISRRDGQETRNNSGTVDAYPANWHSTAVMMSGIWQPNDEHKFTATLDDYHKTNHTHYDTWSNDSIIGDTQQQSDTRRWGIALGDEYTPDNGWVDSLTTRLDYQHTEAHDTSLIPSTSSQSIVYSDYNVETWGLDTRVTKTLGRHDLSAGLNARMTDSERPFRQSPAPSVYSVIMQPQADSRTYILGGYLQDKINFDVEGSKFAVIPAVRLAYQNTKPQNLSSLTTGSTVLTESELETLYGKANSDSQVLPSLTLQYELTPSLLTYVQYKRGAQFPNASQLYGSWNLGSSYAGTAQYALIGNTDLETETSNNVEWGLKGNVTEGVNFSAAMFYNSYKNFIANTRYTRSGNPEKFSNVPSNIYTVYQAENRDKAYIWGGEMSTKVNVGTWFNALNGLSTTLAVGYSEGKSKSSYSGDSYVDLDSVAPMKAVVGMAWDDPAQRYGAAVTATFVKGKKAESTSRESYSNTGTALASGSDDYTRIPGYGMVDMTAYWRVAKNMKLSVGIYNLTDRKYWDYLSSRQLTSTSTQDAYEQALAVMPGRTFQLGVNVDF
ncbi:TonB-dependent receptor domain-containing protein [Erwinia rhapontici]|uniref:TonB-dependent receptor domain-containing protein n=1 Tax=Erwinia rhapontici TaxID=55212 RepID=UPI001331A938|nr:TonB-dependent receptor [Erwinia rhapontici]MBP2156551.1 hemoglobin/transferrin/lactoferrin receptor protein [Erwinia rhapontici]